jgi:glycosyltransferase involved in cell wall biosynthesis
MSGVDVVVPCYNYARYLERCVGSVLGQENVDVRVLIIDDTSKDDSETVGRRIAASDPRVEYRRHEVNKGHIATYNEGLLGWARAEYCLLLSADDVLAPGALGRAVKVLDAHPDVGLAYGAALIMTDDSTVQAPPDAASDDYRVLSSHQFLKRCFERGNPVPTPTAITRTRLQQQLGGYRADLPHAGDMEMWMRFAAHAPVAALRSVQAYYRMHSANMSNFYFSRVSGDTHEQLKVCGDVLAKLGPRDAETAGWDTAMRRRLGEQAFWIGSDLFDRGDAAWRECHALADEICPQLRSSGLYDRFRIKRRFGMRGWSVVRPVFDLLRGPPELNSMASNKPTPVQANRRLGWWPEAGEAAGSL